MSHSDGDGCAVYDPGYRVRRRDDVEPEPVEVDVEDLEPGDVYADPAVDADGTWWTVEEVATVSGDVHLDISRAD